MLPVFLDLKVIRIYTFGVFLVLAFFWASFLLWKNFLLTTHKEEDVFDGLFISLAVGLFISRLVFVALHFGDFGFSVSKFILINGYPGLSLYGFIAGLLLGLYLFFLSRKVKFREVVDYFTPSAFLALAIGQIGSFFSGSTTEATNTKLFLLSLIPVYKALLFFLGAFLTYKILFAIRREKYFKSFNLIFFVWYYSLVESVFELVMGGRKAIIGLNFNTVTSLVLLLTTTFYFLYYFRSLVFGRFAAIRKQGVKKNDKKDHKVTHPGVQGASRKR